MAPKRKLGAPLRLEKRGRKQPSRQPKKAIHKAPSVKPSRRKVTDRKASKLVRTSVRKPARKVFAKVVRKPVRKAPTKPIASRPVRKVPAKLAARKPVRKASAKPIARKLVRKAPAKPIARKPVRKAPAKPIARKPVRKAPVKTPAKPIARKPVRKAPVKPIARKPVRKTPVKPAARKPVRKAPTKPVRRAPSPTKAVAELARAKAALAKAKAELARARSVARAPSKKPAHASKKASRKLLKQASRRDERGRFVTYQRWRKEKAIKRVEKQFAPLIETEDKQEKKRYGITKKAKKQLDRKLAVMARAAEESNFDLQVEQLPSILVDAVRWESAFSVTGLPKDDVDTQRDMLTDVLHAVLAKLPKRRRGWMMSLGMMSEDLLFLMYARKRPIFENRFLRVDSPAEIGLIVNKLRELLDSMEIGRFQVSGMRIQFYYDQHIAKLGLEKAMRKARAKKGV